MNAPGVVRLASEPEDRYYEDMSREELIAHCRAYSRALHALRNKIQMLMALHRAH